MDFVASRGTLNVYRFNNVFAFDKSTKAFEVLYSPIFNATSSDFLNTSQ